MFHKDPRPHPPVIASLTSANAEFNHWLRENSTSQIVDRRGLVWDFLPQKDLKPDPVNLHAKIISLTFTVKTEITRQILLERGFLDASEDQRLLALVGDLRFTLRTRRKICEAATDEVLRTQAHEEFRKFRKQLQIWDSCELVMTRIRAGVDRQFDMTYRGSAGSLGKINLEV